MRRLLALLALTTLVAPHAAGVPVELGERVVLRAAAVVETTEGLVGSTATITLTTATNGTGHIFLDTYPLAEVDMQGSARLAVRVASQISSIPWQDRDFFITMRSGSPVIGGPSAGATLAVGAVAALMEWRVRDDVMMTGTVNPDGSIGPVGGLPEKAAAASRAGMRAFLFPAGQQTALVNGAAVNLSAYCAETLAIQCIPVADVTQAVGWMTDHAFERPPVSDTVTDGTFRDLVAPLSQGLIDAAATRVDEAGAAVEALSSGPRDALAGRLGDARRLLDRARDAAANGSHYTSASLSFQGSIEARYIRDAANVLASPDPSPVAAALLESAKATVESAVARVAQHAVQDTTAFETSGAAQVRAMDAETLLAEATALLAAPNNTNERLQGIYKAAYATERAGTAVWWIQLGEAAPRGAPVQSHQLREAARETLSASQEVVAYVEAVLRERLGGGRLENARPYLALAEAAFERAFYPAAFLHALEAEVRASQFLEFVVYGGLVPDAEFEAARLEAARAIAQARQRGAEPLLAQSQFEFGLSLEGPVERMALLGMSRVTANLAGLPNVLGGGAQLESRFVGLPPARGVEPSWVPAAFAAGLALGVGAGLAAMMPSESRSESSGAKKPQRNSPTQNQDAPAPRVEATARRDESAPPP